MLVQQLLLFPKSDVEILQDEVNRLREQCEKLRKGQYAKIAQVMKECNETKHELNLLKEAICKNQKEFLF